MTTTPLILDARRLTRLEFAKARAPRGLRNAALSGSAALHWAAGQLGRWHGRLLAFMDGLVPEQKGLPHAEISARASGPAVDEPRLADIAQWARAAEPVRTGGARLERLLGHQVAAVDQLDAALYDLRSLVKDLEAVMTVERPADMPPLVHKLEAPAPVRREAHLERKAAAAKLAATG